MGTVHLHRRNRKLPAVVEHDELVQLGLDDRVDDSWIHDLLRVRASPQQITTVDAGVAQAVVVASSAASIALNSQWARVLHPPLAGVVRQPLRLHRALPTQGIS